MDKKEIKTELPNNYHDELIILAHINAERLKFKEAVNTQKLKVQEEFKITNQNNR